MRFWTTLAALVLATGLWLAGCSRQDGTTGATGITAPQTSVSPVTLGDPADWDYSAVTHTLDGYARQGLPDATLLALGYVVGAQQIHIVTARIVWEPLDHYTSLPGFNKAGTDTPGGTVKVTWSRLKKAYR